MEIGIAGLHRVKQSYRTAAPLVKPGLYSSVPDGTVKHLGHKHTYCPTRHVGPYRVEGLGAFQSIGSPQLTDAADAYLRLDNIQGQGHRKILPRRSDKETAPSPLRAERVKDQRPVSYFCAGQYDKFRFDLHCFMVLRRAFGSIGNKIIKNFRS